MGKQKKQNKKTNNKKQNKNQDKTRQDKPYHSGWVYVILILNPLGSGVGEKNLP